MMIGMRKATLATATFERITYVGFDLVRPTGERAHLGITSAGQEVVVAGEVLDRATTLVLRNCLSNFLKARGYYKVKSDCLEDAPDLNGAVLSMVGHEPVVRASFNGADAAFVVVDTTGRVIETGDHVVLAVRYAVISWIRKQLIDGGYICNQKGPADLKSE